MGLERSVCGPGSVRIRLYSQEPPGLGLTDRCDPSLVWEWELDPVLLLGCSP